MNPLALMVIFALISGFFYGSFQVACKRVNTGIGQDKLLIIIYLCGLLFIGGNIIWKSFSTAEESTPTEVISSSPHSSQMMILVILFLSVAAYAADKFAIMANFLPGSDPVAITGIIALSATLAMSMECIIDKALPNRWHLLGCVLVVFAAVALAKGSQAYEAEKTIRAALPEMDGN